MAGEYGTAGVHFLVDRRQIELEQGSRGQDISFKVTSPVTFFLQLGFTSS
jgi:hypothetical protein